MNNAIKESVEAERIHSLTVDEVNATLGSFGIQTTPARRRSDT
jgi:hypothetical protein